MNREGLARLAEVSSGEELRRALEAMCVPFGRVQDIRLVKNRPNATYLCFVELDSPAACASMMRQFGGIYFGTSIAFKIPLNPSTDRD